jgi:hypothetical protein
MTDFDPMRLASISLSTLALSACVGTIGGPTPGEMPDRLTVREVVWNSTNVPIGRPAAVVEEGPRLTLFTDTGAMVFAEGVVATNDTTITGWREATTIPAADGTSGTWTVAIDGTGRLYRSSADHTLESIADRYGLTGADVRHVAALGGRYVMFALATSFAVSDGAHVTRYDDASYAANLAGGSARAAGVADGMVRVFDTAGGTSVSFPLAGAHAAVFDASGKLLVATDDALYAENARGALEPVFDGPVGALAKAGPRVWFTTGSELGLLDGNSIAVTSGQQLAANVRLSGSPSGDVWIFDGPALRRYACDSCRAGPDETWRATIQPIFTNYCAQCHRPGGVANIDLSTYEAWTARRAAIRMRVVVTGDMPPPGNPLPDADRMTIADWVANGM